LLQESAVLETITVGSSASRIDGMELWLLRMVSYGSSKAMLESVMHGEDALGAGGVGWFGG
jgi:hypothetical protein